MRNKSTEPKAKVQELFCSSSGKAVVGSFGAGLLSTFGGTPLIWMVELATGYVKQAAECIKDWRAPHLIKYKMFNLLWQRILLICAGFADTNDSNFLRHDAALKLAMGLDLDSEEHLASQPTMSRLENEMSSKDCYKLAVFMVLSYIARKKKAPKRLILDFDGSSFETRGNQQGSSYRGHWEVNMLFPLLVYDQDGWLICAILRPGKDGEARLLLPVLRRLVKAFRAEWPRVSIILRVDAAFGSSELFDWCEDQGKEEPELTVHYITVMKTPPEGNGVTGVLKFKEKRNVARRQFGRLFGEAEYGQEGAKKKYEVEREILALPKKERKAALKRLKRRFVRVFADDSYQTGKGGQDKNGWRSARRVVAVFVHDDWGLRSRYFVTNLPSTDSAQYLIEELYSARGAAELRIKEYRGQDADKMSCSEFIANQVRLLFHALAYNTMYTLREQLPAARRKWTFETIRVSLIRMAVHVEETKEAILLSWSKDFPFKREFWACEERLRGQRLRC
ncbi:MAG: IS1380 family transposase [Candidatus Competibacteraceae bacterium]|nr:IS1380 family transposase [Candidatus Competibacteraceae bacterium]